ncbi:hypothetical protein BJF79_03320 [Actinomadura sp. CNU-125]|uniref:hypothetical protein n=1 Tax=Actinomadura sp. CNU-125 TaxID=1904961 RepID=UPI00095F03A6|nr:hypothetical protein [Actinomadura sp. CNU-125]OLT12943.1 hypothetical protein BJF79_03320 [Actinomadura sp. CNU-125]
MCALQATQHLATEIRDSFDSDVADAILADTDPLEVAARLCKDATADDVTATVKAIASDIDDGLADWLVEQADSPAAWFCGQVRDRI